MSGQIWTTRGLAAHEQFSALRDLMLDGPFAMRLERPGRLAAEPISADMMLEQFDGVAKITASAGAALGAREGREIARGSADFMSIHLPKASGWYDLDGTRIEIEGGDVLLVDGETPIVGGGGEDVRFEMWLLPRTLAQPFLKHPREPMSGLVRSTSALGRLVGSYLVHLGPALASAPPDARSAMLDVAGQLIALDRGMAPAASDIGRQAVAQAKLAQVKEIVRQGFRDPAMSPATVAAMAGISIRRLHLLFEPTGVSFGRHLSVQRLNWCREALAGARFSQWSITEVAFAGGFTSLATFYRLFRHEFGCTPSDLRHDRPAKPPGRR